MYFLVTLAAHSAIESSMHVCILVTASIFIKHNGDTCALHAYILF